MNLLVNAIFSFMRNLAVRMYSVKMQISYGKERKVKSFSHVPLCATPWTVAHQAPPSMGFSRQEYWSGLPFLSPEDLTDPGIELRSPILQADALPPEPPGKPICRSHSCSQT